MSSQSLTQIQIKIDPRIKDLISKEAKNEFRTLSGFMTHAALDYIARKLKPVEEIKLSKKSEARLEKALKDLEEGRVFELDPNNLDMLFK